MNFSSYLSGALTIAFIEALFFEIVGSIDCYQCSTPDNIDCGDVMIHDPDGRSIQPVSCSHIFEARYCIKTTGVHGGGLGTKRFCSSLDLGNYCNYIKQPGDVLEYRSCVYTCSSDGCNSSSTITVQPLVFCQLNASDKNTYI
ncbi:hypothetical protein LSTR_LSTR011619 [Laodelphax striatellus]|uniref:Uncharacterized protein n=1 Tax=Laodelphax striatellus TaxID=195883 RepID=A0A482X7C4_LAOST|nr:hypothetical protein LSTR_LSTR011619 [Laodelphax striatellus]